jgi:uncharacterized membrane protein YbaN (DUF454 family)
MQTTATSPPTRPWLRPLYFAAGMIFVVLGVIGAFLPVIPTTGPLILAAFFFSRSSHRVHTWLVTHPRFGRVIREFETDRRIPLRAKVLALATMVPAFVYAAGWLVTHPVPRLALVAVGVWAVRYVAKLPTSEPRDAG